MTVARLRAEMTLAEFLGWMDFFAQRRDADKEPELDLATATPAQLQGLFG